MRIFQTTLMCFALISIVSLTNCGKDGKDGSSYITYDWDYLVDTYSDNNPQVTSPLTVNEEYKVNAGNYIFSYQCSDGQGNFWEYTGNYRITIDKGTEGKGFKDGSDGGDRLFEMILTGTGYVFSSGPRDGEVNKIRKEFLEPASRTVSNADKRPVGEIETEVFEFGNMTVVVNKQCYEIIR